MKNKFYTALLVLILVFSSLDSYAQFQEPKFEKVTKAKRSWFMNKFDDIKWTGQGLYGDTKIDDVQTDELRSRLQAQFGKPTQKIEDLIHQDNFRPGKAIEFEYWFTVDDSIPLMVLDVDGPFGKGLVYGGASRYIDLMPEIKRTLSRKLMNVQKLAEYQDYFYSPEREQWFDVSYAQGEFSAKKIDTPEGMKIEYDY